jgi:hypothetical protein
MNPKSLKEAINELNMCNSDFEALLQEEVAILQNGDNEGLLKNVEAKSEKCREKMNFLKGFIFNKLMEMGCAPSAYLQRNASGYFHHDDVYAAASKVAALLKYYEIINIRADENKLIDCILRASGGDRDVLDKVLFDMKRDFRDFYAWGQF